MTECCHIDIETFSEAPLKKCGLYRYSADPSTEILCTCYAFGEGNVYLWIPKELWEVPIQIIAALDEALPGRWTASQECPPDLAAWVLAGKQLRAHNAQFERKLLNGHAGQKVKFPHTTIGQWVCTAAKAASHGMQRALGDVAKALGTRPKDEHGKSAMYQLTKPCAVTKKHPLGRFTWNTDLQKFIDLYLYCADDVYAERDVDNTIPDMSPSEQEDWELDQLVNERGVRVDLGRVKDVWFLIEQYKVELEKEFLELTGVKPSQTQVVAEWIRERLPSHLHLDNLQAATVEMLVKQKGLPDDVKRALIVRSIHSSKASAKYPAILRAVMTDDRIRGMFLYYGAGTGRWSSMIVQLQNLFRGAIPDPNVAIEAYRTRSLEWIRILFSPLELMKVFASTVRGMLIPAEGKDFIALDFAGIESRVIAWIYDEAWKLKAFRLQDSEGAPDNYMWAYANTFKVDVLSVNKDQRQIGKPIDLGLGFQGGVAAFVTMSKTYKVDLAVLTEMAWSKLDPELIGEAKYAFDQGWIGQGIDLPERIILVCDAIKRAWRRSHPKIVQGWEDTNDAAKAAVRHPGKVFKTPNGKLMFKVEGRWLYMRLPSGRKLAYYMPRIEKDDSVSFMGLETKTRRWMRCKTYGGFWAQNATQAIANDLLRAALKRWEKVGYTAVGSVHDEGILEIPKGWGSLEEATEIMCVLPRWAKGLPVAAEGWRGGRYKK